MIEPHALVTPLKAIRMLLDGTGVLVRAERWKEINETMTTDERPMRKAAVQGQAPPRTPGA